MCVCVCVRVGLVDSLPEETVGDDGEGVSDYGESDPNKGQHRGHCIVPHQHTLTLNNITEQYKTNFDTNFELSSFVWIFVLNRKGKFK